MPTVTVAGAAPASASAVDQPITTNDVRSLPAAVKRTARLQGFEGKLGQTLLLAGDEAPVRVLVGLGPRRELTADKVRRAAAAYARAVARHRSVACTIVPAAVDAGVDAGDAVAAAVEGLRLASYRFTDYRDAVNLKSPVELAKVTLVASGRGLSAAAKRADATADAVELARDLGNTPGGDLTPEEFVRRARRALRGTGVRMTAWDEERIQAEKLGGVLAVNQGSVHPPRFVQLRYQPDGRDPKGEVALVGKGITFDSGGLSLKTAQGMMSMKIDMAGGAAVLATMTALKAHRVPVAVTGYIPLTDNMTGGDAQRPGDVFTARNGKTVEVLNTDAEGRLILADALSLAAEREPDAIIDIATLTGSASAALGTSYAALMATDDKLAGRLEAASGRTGENLWRLPLPPEYRPQLDSNVADLKNIGAGPFGGALIAGLFLKEFTGKSAWAHIDLGMSAISDTERGVVVKGATGLGVRVLLDTLVNW
ncbi:MAG: leucyl aminopeptidase [Actinomycetota bacterium]